MSQTASYAIARLAAGEARDERLNIGVIVFHQDTVEVHLARRLDKVKAISAALDPEIVRENLLSIVDLDAALLGQGISSALDRRNELTSLGFANLSDLQSLEFHNRAGLDASIARIMGAIVEPEPAPIREPRSRSRLLSSVKKALKADRLLGRIGDDISNHQIIPDVVLAEGLIADLFLKNGSMHVTKTVDASSDEVLSSSTIKQVGVSSLVLEQAKIKFGGNSTVGRLIFDASTAVEKHLMPALKAVEHQGAYLINWRSLQDQRRFLSDMGQLAIPSDKESRSERFVTSNQDRLKLN